MIEILTNIATETFNEVVISDRYPNNQELMKKINELIEEINRIKKLIEPTSH